MAIEAKDCFFPMTKIVTDLAKEARRDWVESDAHPLDKTEELIPKLYPIIFGGIFGAAVDVLILPGSVVAAGLVSVGNQIERRSKRISNNTSQGRRGN